MPGCLACTRDLHEECEYDKCPICSVCNPELKITVTSDEPEVKRSLYDRSKEFKDPHSTGRHRAAQLYPYVCDSCEHTLQQHKKEGACTKEVCDCSSFVWKPCQWRGFKNNGGGTNPIVGCADGTQFDRHHGPCKDPLRNELGNVHLLCVKCHQRWHILNDEYYDEKEFLKTSHDPQPATDKEIFDNELKWQDGWFNRHYKLKKISKRIDDD